MDEPLLPLDSWLVQCTTDYNISPNLAFQKGNPTVTLEKTSTANNACFWECIAEPSGLTVRWGIQGTQGNSRKFAVNECLGQNPMRELQKRVNSKLQKTYSLLEYDHI